MQELGKALFFLKEGFWILDTAPYTVEYNNITARALTVANPSTGEKRNILAYKMKFTVNKPFLYMLTDEMQPYKTPYNRVPTVNNQLADGQEHLVFTVTHHSPETGYTFETDYYNFCSRIGIQSISMKLFQGDEGFMHAADVVPAWAIVALEKAGVDIGMKTDAGDKDYIENFVEQFTTLEV